LHDDLLAEVPHRGGVQENEIQPEDSPE